MKIGDRVGAIESMDEREVRLFGYGVYNGDQEISVHEMLGISREFLEQEVDRMMANGDLKEDFEYVTTNPQIQLDDGSIIWGYQCWWGPEDAIRAKIGNRKVINV